MKSIKNNIFRSEYGFTLIEMIVAMAITVFMVGMVGFAYSTAAREYVRTKETYQTQMRSRLVIDYIGQELRNGGYLINWDGAYWNGDPNNPPLDINDAVAVPTKDANTDSITVRYALGPLTAGGPLTAQINPNPVATGSNTLNVDPLPFPIPLNSWIAVYGSPTTVNFRQVTIANNVGDGLVTINPGILTPVQFNANDFVARVQETSFWVQNGNLMTNSGGANQILATNVEDLQVALITKNQGIIGDGDVNNNGLDDTGAVLADDPTFLTANQILEVRAIRVSLTSRSNRQLVDQLAQVPPSLEDRDRSVEVADRILRRIQQTTVFLRNFGSLD